MFLVRYSLLLSLFFVQMNLSAQWKKIYTPYTNDLFDVCQVPGKAYAAGQGSTVLQSSDSGKSWKKLSLTIPSNLRTVYFFDSLTGLVSGENARIQKTYNGGKTWTQKYVRTAAFAYDIDFSGDKGIAVGKDLLAISSVDAGETWTVDTTPQVRKQLNSVSISASGNCWTVGDSGFIFRKHLSEKKWTQVTSGTIINLTNVSTIGDSFIIISGGMPDTALVGKHLNILLFSFDNGNTWLSTTLKELKTIYSAYFFNEDTGFICGTNGIISKSYQIFNQRSQQLSGTASALNKINFFNNNGLIVGDGGTILRSTNRGGPGLNITLTSRSPIQIYPNPSSGNFSIKNIDETIVSVKAFDCTGKETTLSKNNDYYSLPDAGIYTIQIYLNNGQYWHSTIQIH